MTVRVRAAVGVTYSPAVTTRDVTAGGSTSSTARRSVAASAEGVGPAANAAVLDANPSTSSVCHGDTVPEPVGRLGDVVTLDTLPGPVGRVSGLTRQSLASARGPRLWGWS